MKFVISLALSLTILFPAWINSALLLHYGIYKEYYAQNLCENQDKPAMNCEGFCQLSKQLKQAEMSHQKKEIEYVSHEWQLFLTIQTFVFHTPLPNSEYYDYYLISPAESKTQPITPPPQLS